jgi:putative tryptophan/tyrosine transport system substrate-binding protein
MQRREALAIIAGAVVALPLAARAQQKAMPVIGYLSGGSTTFYAPILPSFHEGLRESGYVEGRNVAIDYRWAEGRYDRLPGFAAEFVSRSVDLITASGGPAAALAAKGATSTIPIVFTAGTDPVAAGLVASFARPGGNLTGISFLVGQLMPKRLELVSELVPQIRVVALLINPKNQQYERAIGAVQEAARAKGMQLHVLEASTEGEINSAFAALVNVQAGALVVATDPVLDSRREQVIAMASQDAVPAIYGFREFAAVGGLISYGPSLGGVYRQAGIYAGKILNGAKPAELPTKFELVINMKTATALGLTVPQSLLQRADEVIE